MTSKHGTIAPDPRRAPDPGFAARVGGWSAAHRKTAVIGWLLLVTVVTTLASMAGTTQASTVDRAVGESGRALKILDEAGLSAPASEFVLVHSDTLTATDAAFSAAAAQVASAVQATGAVADVAGPDANGLVSADAHSALVTFTVTGDADTAKDRIEPVMDAVEKVAAAHPDLVIEQVGDASAESWLMETFNSDFATAEWTAVPIALAILLFTFASLVAAVLPVVLAVTAYVLAAALVAFTSRLLPTTEDAGSVMLLVGLAVGVDYCLFYLRREREERAAGRSLGEALSIAGQTSGRAVLVSGLTVVAAMASTFFTGVHDFKALGLATIVVVLVAVGGSLTVLPALMAMLGDKVDAAGLPWLAKRRRRALAEQTTGKLWGPLTRTVVRRPVLWTALGTIALLALAAPVLGIRTAQLSVAQELSPDTQFVQTAARINAAFPGAAAPATVVVTAPDVSSPAMTAALESFKTRSVATGEVLEPVVVTPHADQGIVEVSLQLAGDGNDETSEHALATLRSSVIPATIGTVPGAAASVTGVTAASVDFTSRITDSAPWVVGFVLGLAFLLMLCSFRSLTIAVTTVVLNVLSVGASYGVLVLVFQKGYGEALFGAHDVGAINSWVPMFLFIILFGLSMDYHVFVVSRIVEGHHRGLSTRAAIVAAMDSTAAVITSAALIMVGIFAIFGTLSVESMKQIGFGLGVAVLIDATVIRGVLLPASLAALGEATWYLPSWLGWLPTISHGPVEEPTAGGDTADEEPAAVASPAVDAAPAAVTPAEGADRVLIGSGWRRARR
ncbi:MAG: MMPL family transporter [Kineosporiaceae bacterium]